MPRMPLPRLAFACVLLVGSCVTASLIATQTGGAGYVISSDYKCAAATKPIKTWSECKSANAASFKKVVKAAFSDNSWSYGCILISGKLYFNGNVGSTEAHVGKPRVRPTQKSICSVPPPPAIATSSAGSVSYVAELVNVAARVNGSRSLAKELLL